MGSGPERRWTSYSTAKSITATLVGAALHDGAIGSLDDRGENYLPRVHGSAYEGVTVRNVLRMCSGVAWNETDDGQSDVERLRQALASRAAGFRPKPCVQPAARSSARRLFDRRELGACAVCAATTGRPLADDCAETIWRLAGMEAHGYWPSTPRAAWNWGDWRQCAPARRRPLRPTGDGGR